MSCLLPPNGLFLEKHIELQRFDKTPTLWSKDTNIQEAVFFGLSFHVQVQAPDAIVDTGGKTLFFFRNYRPRGNSKDVQ